VTNVHELPPDLPVPEDDGAADHLDGMQVPRLELPTTDGYGVDLAEAAQRTLVVFVYPRTGRPDQELPPGWDDIPGARGCTPQACAFRDHHAELAALGARVLGLSSQTTAYQAEAARRLELPYPLASDPVLAVADALGLPTFPVDGIGTLYKRLTFVARAGTIEKVIYPVFPPGSDAQEVVGWLRARA
jgi:peroxiredoxin